MPNLDGDFNAPDGMTSEDIAVKIDGDADETSPYKTLYLVSLSVLGVAATAAVIFLARLHAKKSRAKRKERTERIMRRQTENAERFVAKDPVLYADIADMARYGKCRFIYAREDGVLFQDDGGFYKHGTYVFAAESENAARRILLLCPEELENIGNGLLACHGEKISAFCRDFFAFDCVTPCYQVVYRPASPLPLKGALRFEKASGAYLSKIVETYDRETPEALEKLVKQGKIYCAFAAGAQGESAEKEAFVGYIGQHPEGSMGLLYIFPEFRRRGYAEELESFQINSILTEGRTPYAHIIEDNFKSFALQQKL
ncbi:MAG: GNAT family N-acetyltransferase, partial [Candidatus Scatosoma sp.]